MFWLCVLYLEWCCLAWNNLYLLCKMWNLNFSWFGSHKGNYANFSKILQNLHGLSYRYSSFNDGSVRDRGSNMKTKAWSLEKSLKMFFRLYAQLLWVTFVLVVILNVHLSPYHIFYASCIIMNEWEESFWS